MPNPTQQILQQARDAIPGQRSLRLPWQQPNLGERAADVTDMLADRTGDFSLHAALDQARAVVPSRRRRFRLPWQRPTAAERAASALDTLAVGASGLADRASTMQAQAVSRARDARDATVERTRAGSDVARDRARELAQTAQDRTLEAAATTLDQLSDVRAWLADQLAAARDRTATAASAAPVAQTTDALDKAITSITSTSGGGAGAPAALAGSAADRAATATSQVAALLDRLLARASRPSVLPAGVSQKPTDVEIRIGEAAKSPLARAADTIARAVEVAGETIYDYSGGHYGMEPIDAAELRREHKRELGKAPPVAIIEGHYQDDAHRGGSWVPVAALIVGVTAGMLGVAIWQRRRLQAVASQVLATGRRTVQQAQHQVAGSRSTVPADMSASVDAKRFAPTPAFDRVVRGELLAPGGSAGRSDSAESAKSTTTTAPTDGATPPLS